MTSVEQFLIGCQAEIATARAHVLRALSHLERSGRHDLSAEGRQLRQLAANLTELEGGLRAAYDQERGER